MHDVLGRYTYQGHWIKGICPKYHTYLYSSVLELLLCYSYLSDSTLRISIFAEFSLFQFLPLYPVMA